jgi:hypothetical protein
LSVTERFAVRAPVAVGLKVTPMLQLAPAARVAPQVVVLAKSPALVPVNAMLVILILAFPVFDNVTVRELLVVLTNCTAKAKEVGESCAAGPVPVPVRVTDWGVVGSESAILSDAVRVPGAEGRKVTLMVQLFPAATLVPQVFV